MYQKVLAVIMSVLLTLPLVASGQASDTIPANTTAAPSPASVPHLKSPVVATLISIVVPGGGQMYAGKRAKGGTLLTLVFAGTGATALLAASEFTLSYEPTSHYAPAIIAGVATLGVWGYSIVSALFDAREYNERHQQRHAILMQPIIQLGSASKLGRTQTQFGLNLKL